MFTCLGLWEGPCFMTKYGIILCSGCVYVVSSTVEQLAWFAVKIALLNTEKVKII